MCAGCQTSMQWKGSFCLPGTENSLVQLICQGCLIANTLNLKMWDFKTVVHSAILCNISFILELLDFKQIKASVALTKLKLQDLTVEEKMGKYLKTFLEEAETIRTNRGINLFWSKMMLIISKKEVVILSNLPWILLKNLYL